MRAAAPGAFQPFWIEVVRQTVKIWNRALTASLQRGMCTHTNTGPYTHTYTHNTACWQLGAGEDGLLEELTFHHQLLKTFLSTFFDQTDRHQTPAERRHPECCCPIPREEGGERLYLAAITSITSRTAQNLNIAISKLAMETPELWNTSNMAKMFLYSHGVVSIYLCLYKEVYWKTLFHSYTLDVPYEGHMTRVKIVCYVWTEKVKYIFKSSKTKIHQPFLTANQYILTKLQHKSKLYCCHLFLLCRPEAGPCCIWNDYFYSKYCKGHWEKTRPVTQFWLLINQK